MVNQKKKLLFALAMALVAVAVCQLYIETEASKYRPSGYVDALIAAQPITAGTVLTAGLVKHKRIPKDAAPLSALVADQLQEFIGQTLITDVPPGEYLLQSQFELRRASGASLSAQITGPDARAVTIQVSETNSLAVSLAAGDLIDILYTFDVPGANEQMSTVLLQSVPVLATGTYEPEEELRRTHEYSTVTLLVNAKDALRLKFAQKTGTIDIALRSSGDTSALSAQPLLGVRDVLSDTERTRLDDFIAKHQAPIEEKLPANLLQQLKDAGAIQ